MNSMVKVWVFIFVLTAVAYGSFKGYQTWKSPPKKADEFKEYTLDRNKIIFDEIKGKTLLNRFDKTFRLDDLKGKVWVANMFFASCPHSCAKIMRQVEQLQSDPALKDAQFISITTNPTADNSKALLIYSNKFHVNTGQWHFLNGDPELTKQLSKQLFGVTLKGFDDHVKRLNLFDQEGKLVDSCLYSEPLEIAKMRQKIIQLTAPAMPKSNQAPRAPEPPSENE